MVGELYTGFLDDKSIVKDPSSLDLALLVYSLESMDQYFENDLYSSPWRSFFGSKVWDDDSEGYFWTENKRYLLLFVTPVMAKTGFGKAQESLAALRKTVDEAMERFGGIQAGVTGQEALNVDEMTLAMGDMSIGTIISLVGVTILLVVFWRGSRLPLFGIAEMLTSLCLTFGLTTLIIGHLNILSVVFAPLLLGLSIDYGTHWLSRYQEEVENNGLPRRNAILKTMVEVGPGLIYAGLCAALSFFPLALTGFKGLAELGIICSIGMLMTTITSSCVLPAITLLFDTKARSKKLSPARHKPLIQFTRPRALVVLTASCVAMAVSFLLAKGITFDLNMLNLQSKNAESVIWEKRLLGDSQRSSMHGAILARSMDEVRRKTKAAEALPTISDVVSVNTFLPHDQESKLEVVWGMRGLLPDRTMSESRTDAVDVQNLRDTLSRIAFKMAPDAFDLTDRPVLKRQMSQVRELVARIDRRLGSGDRAKSGEALQRFQSALMEDLQDKLVTLRLNTKRTVPVQVSDLPGQVLQRYFDGNQLYLLRVFPAQDIWQPEPLGRFVQDLRAIDADAIGDPVTLFTFTKAFRDGCVKAVVYALVFIVALLLLIFRSPIYTLVAIVPLIAGTAWTVGLMACFGINLNLANSLFLPMIVGAGVEYAIIIVQRWNRGSAAGVLPLSTGKGVIIAGLSTTVGFGSLAVSSHQGIYSLGLLAGIGSLCVLAAALLTLPAILHLLPIPTVIKASGIVHIVKHTNIAAVSQLGGAGSDRRIRGYP
jgi:hopanoid biosynthesis associated RND transporter like protein HpnN